MRCPLLAIGWSAARGGEKTFPADCLKEKCAWFIGDEDICVLVSIFGVLAHIQMELNKIAKELTLLRSK